MKIYPYSYCDVDNETSYKFDGLKCNDSAIHGKGVFATKLLLCGTKVELLGETISARQQKTLHEKGMSTHVYQKTSWKTRKTYLIDGHPRYKPDSHGVGGRGLYIAMMVNEPNGRKKPNCRFRGNHLVVERRINAGEELFVDYGPGYGRNGYDKKKGN